MQYDKHGLYRQASRGIRAFKLALPGLLVMYLCQFLIWLVRSILQSSSGKWRFYRDFLWFPTTNVGKSSWFFWNPGWNPCGPPSSSASSSHMELEAPPANLWRMWPLWMWRAWWANMQFHMTNTQVGFLFPDHPNTMVVAEFWHFFNCKFCLEILT